jgi:hypothetical protein
MNFINVLFIITINLKLVPIAFKKKLKKILMLTLMKNVDVLFVSVSPTGNTLILVVCYNS